MRLLLLPFAALAICASASPALDYILSRPDLSIFASLLKLSPDAAASMDGSSPATVFAPVDSAWSMRPWSDFRLAFLESPSNARLLTRLLQYHVARGFYPASALDSAAVPSLPTAADGAALSLTGACSVACILADEACAAATIADADHAFGDVVVHAVTQALVPRAVFCPDTLLVADSSNPSLVYAAGFDCRRRRRLTALAFNANITEIAALSVSDEFAFTTVDSNAAASVELDSFSGSSAARTVAQLNSTASIDAGDRIYVAARGGIFSLSTAGDLSPVMTGPSLNALDVAYDPSVGSTSALFAVVRDSSHADPYIVEALSGATLVSSAPGAQRLCVDRERNLLYYTDTTGGIHCFSYGSIPCTTASGTDPLLPFDCAAESLWAAYGGPAFVVTTRPASGGVVLMDANMTIIDTIFAGMRTPAAVGFACVGTATLKGELLVKEEPY